ncbi:hypothetical protein GGTG_14108 [Gaeumannomyces tritici R3-111a-1]|uniref:Uncharacterized protein n=1 Tax=Gaeumannomyces tritici (strain R3-111a-1) TaxID=644352 RepID=J3PKP4_GAET3|nr:hypothetical protein GGTG_14108 [Gaeumannomyces tritici R3-111a-1]EJT68312.1 hypothetical protein GGTG_14108 [Gaeumannomyces tritici R3-111a-1]
MPILSHCTIFYIITHLTLITGYVDKMVQASVGRASDYDGNPDPSDPAVRPQTTFVYTHISLRKYLSPSFVAIGFSVDDVSATYLPAALYRPATSEMIDNPVTGYST